MRVSHCSHNNDSLQYALPTRNFSLCTGRHVSSFDAKRVVFSSRIAERLWITGVKRPMTAGGSAYNKSKPDLRRCWNLLANLFPSISASPFFISFPKLKEREREREERDKALARMKIKIRYITKKERGGRERKMAVRKGEGGGHLYFIFHGSVRLLEFLFPYYYDRSGKIKEMPRCHRSLSGNLHFLPCLYLLSIFFLFLSLLLAYEESRDLEKRKGGVKPKV